MALLTEPSLSRLLIEVRLLLNQPQEANSFWSNAELTSYLNDAIRFYFIKVSERAEGQFDSTPVNLNIVMNQEEVALPSDCFEVRALYKKQDNYYKMLVYKNNLSSDYSTEGGTDGNSYEPYYYFRGNSLVLRPVPQYSETAGLKLEYTAFPETLIWGGDTLSSRVCPVFKELIVLFTAYKAKVKESAVTGTQTYASILEHLNSTYKTFEESVGLRSKYPQYTKPFIPE